MVIAKPVQTESVTTTSSRVINLRKVLFGLDGKVNWIQDDTGTDVFLSSCIYDDRDITVKLNGLNTACIILPNTVVMLKRKAGDKWLVAVVGTDTVQLKYSEEMTKTLIKHIDVSSLVILEGVLRIVLVDNEEDTESINTTQFFLNLVKDIKVKEESDLNSC